MSRAKAVATIVLAWTMTSVPALAARPGPPPKVRDANRVVSRMLSEAWVGGTMAKAMEGVHRLMWAKVHELGAYDHAIPTAGDAEDASAMRFHDGSTLRGT